MSAPSHHLNKLLRRITDNKNPRNTCQFMFLIISMKFNSKNVFKNKTVCLVSTFIQWRLRWVGISSLEHREETTVTTELKKKHIHKRKCIWIYRRKNYHSSKGRCCIAVIQQWKCSTVHLSIITVLVLGRNFYCTCRGYPAKRALSAMRKHGG